MRKHIHAIIEGNYFVSAPVYEESSIEWRENYLKCPLCGEFHTPHAVLDMAQLALMPDEPQDIHTIMKCRKCEQAFALHYRPTEITGESHE